MRRSGRDAGRATPNLSSRRCALGRASLESPQRLPGKGSLVEDDVAAYINGIDARRRPLFDRVHRLVMVVQPDARMSLL